MGGGGGQQGTTTTTPGAPQYPPEFGPYIGALGGMANQVANLFPITPFIASPMPAPVPQLSPLQQMGMQHVYTAGQYGIPTPQGHQTAYNAITDPNSMIRPPDSPTIQSGRISGAGANIKAGQAPNEIVGLSDLENEAAGYLRQFGSGDLGDSPAVQSARAAIEQYVVPQTGNAMAKAGLGHSGAMGSELQKQMTANLLPVYLQGMQQQESAAQKMAGIGREEALREGEYYNRGLNQAALDTQAGIAGGQLAGQMAMRQGELDTQANIASGNLFGQIQSAFAGPMASQYNANLNALTGLGNAETDRYNQMINSLFNAGAIDRDVASQMSQSYYNDFLRRQALSEQFSTALLSSLAGLTAYPSTTHQTSESGK